MTIGASVPPGATPLSEDESEGLIPDLATQGELNEWEQANILRAVVWAERGSRGSVVAVGFVVDLHRRMFDQTWDWAGKFRRSDKSIGVHWPHVQTALRDLIADTKHWIENRTYSVDELGVRFHHRLVQVHPFPNGNGRHSRLITDLLIDEVGGTRSTWGRSGLRNDDETRRQYIVALRAADAGEFRPLLAFVRS